MEYSKIEQYTLKLSFKELRLLKQLVRTAILVNNQNKVWVELTPEELKFAKEIYDL